MLDRVVERDVDVSIGLALRLGVDRGVYNGAGGVGVPEEEEERLPSWKSVLLGWIGW